MTSIVSRIMTRSIALLTWCFVARAFAIGQTESTSPPTPPARLQPGETRRDLPTVKLRGELLTLDLSNRTGTFRQSSDGSIHEFIALPHVICQHHLSTGELADYRIGEHLRFIMYENNDGKFNLLGLVAEELFENVSHDEPYFVDRIDTESGVLFCTRANRDKTKIVWPDMKISTDKETRYWREGKPDGKFSDIVVGMPLFAKTHGSSGLVERTAWDILLDDASVRRFKEVQTDANDQRLQADGYPGYIDSCSGKELRLTLFPEATDYIAKRKGLKKGDKTELSIAGLDRKGVGQRIRGVLTNMRVYIKQSQYITEATIALDAPVPADFKPTSVVRLWSVSPDLRLARDKNWLVIKGRHLPTGEIRINYLEAYCRSNSTEADWHDTTIGHTTELISLSEDKKKMQLRCSLKDGVVVDHVITATTDDIAFGITARNPTEKDSEAHWAQPCIRLGDFTGHSNQGKDLDDYLPKCFIFLDDKLTRMNEIGDWKKDARYVPGQVWCPRDVPRTDVNPRPLSSLVPSNGLIGCFSGDEKWIFAVAFEPYQELFQGVARCLHSDFRIGGLRAGETKSIKGKIYIVPNDVSAIRARYEKDFVQTSSAPSPPHRREGGER